MGTEYTVSTPLGSLVVTWPEDEHLPAEYRGSEATVAYFSDYLDLEMVTGRGGVRLSLQNMEPADLYGFCNSEKYGIFVLPEWEDILEEMHEAIYGAPSLDYVLTADREDLKKQLAQMLASVSDASVLDRIKISKEMTEIIARLKIG